MKKTLITLALKLITKSLKILFILLSSQPLFSLVKFNTSSIHLNEIKRKIKYCMSNIYIHTHTKFDDNEYLLLSCNIKAEIKELFSTV